MAAGLAIRAPRPMGGGRKKAPPMIKAAPVRARNNPSQNLGIKCSLKINQAPSATQRGAVFPSKVAFAAVVKASEEFQMAKSSDVNRPASAGYRYRMGENGSLLVWRWMKNGVRMMIENSRR